MGTLDTRLLAGYTNPATLPMPERVTPDIQGFYESFQKGKESTRKREIEDEELRMRKETQTTNIESQKFLNRIRERQQELQEKTFEFNKDASDKKYNELYDRTKFDREKLIKDTEKVKIESDDKKLAEFTDYQDNIFKLIEKSKDKTTRKRLIDVYNKNELTKKFNQELVLGENEELSFKTSAPYEKELDKRSAIQVADNVKESQAIQTAIQTNSNLLSYVQQADPKAFGASAEYERIAGNLLQTLGYDNDMVKRAIEQGKLDDALQKTVLTNLKPLLGGAFTASEGERVGQAIGSITDPKEVVEASIKMLVANDQMKIENIGIQNILLSKSPDNLATSPLVISRIQDFPKVMVDPTNKKTMTFYEFQDLMKRSQPQATYLDVRKEWDKYYNGVMNSNIDSLSHMPKNVLEALQGL